jgi:hypothetical protein
MTVDIIIKNADGTKSVSSVTAVREINPISRGNRLLIRAETDIIVNYSDVIRITDTTTK